MTASPTAPAAADAVARARASVHYAGLDGLRAVAVAAVIVYHLFPGVLPGGFLGVDVFFVISGFLITSLLLRERAASGRIALGAFWRRRFRRLVPALGLVVLACTSAALAVGGDVLVGIGRQVLGAATFSNNWLDIAAGSSYFGRDAPELFRNLWSLAVEEQFYLLWPLLVLALLLVRSRAVRFALVAGLAACSAAWMAALFAPDGDPTRVYFGTDTHSFGLLMGAALALALARARPLDLDAGESAAQRFARRRLPALGLVGLAALLAAFRLLGETDAFTYRGGILLASVAALAVVWAAVAPGSPLGRALDVAPLRAVGVRSYGLYLWHWPLFLLAGLVLPADLGPWRSLTVGLVTIAATAAASWLSYRYVEQPFRRHGTRGTVRILAARLRASRPARPVLVAGLALVAVALGGTITAVAVAPDRTAAQALVARGEHAVRDGGPQHRSASRDETIPTGDRITAVGDSVMLASAPELQDAFPGIAIDAKVSRPLSAAPAILHALEADGALRHVVLIGLGTNGPIELDTLREIRRIAGPDREIVLVNVQAPRSWTAGVNTTLARFARDNPRTVALADWRDAIADHLDLLADDRIHPGSRGGAIYAATVRTALERLAAMPPVKRLDLHGPGPRPL